MDVTDRPATQKVNTNLLPIHGNTSQQTENCQEEYHDHVILEPSTEYLVKENTTELLDKATLLQDQEKPVEIKIEEKKSDEEVLTSITVVNFVKQDIEGVDTVDGKPTFGIIRSERKDYMGIRTVHTTYPHRIVSLKSQRENTKSFFQKIHEFFIPPTTPSDSHYDMTCYPRGVFTLINMYDFWDRENNPPRNGTNTDAEALTDLFLDLGFVVERFDNPSSTEVDLIINKAANTNYSNKSCCACAILSHGDNGKFSSKDGEIDIDEMVKKFQTKKLAGKPKFFIIQACRGEVYMDGFDTTDGRVTESPTQSKSTLSIPAESDFLYAYSTVPGYFSWRNDLKGAWFIQDLVEVFRNEAHRMDVLRMLIRVNEKVALRLPKTAYEELNKKKQVPSFVCQLRKDLFLIPPCGPLISK